MDDISRIDNCRSKNANSALSNQSDREALPFQPRSATKIRNASHQHEKGIRGAPYTTTTYYNYTGRDVVLTSRDGSAIVVPPINEHDGDEIIVCVSRTMSKEAMIRALDTLRARVNPDDRENHYWSRAYEHALHMTTHTTVTASVEYVIYWRDLVDAGGRVYMPDVDLLVEWQSDRGAIHPFDKSKRDSATLSSFAPGIGEGTFGFMIKAVDNAHQIQRSTRYVNIGGEVFMIPVERDLEYATGIHVVSRTPVKGGRAVNETIYRSYTFEEADKKFGLHRTVEDAVNGGPMTDMAKHLIERDTTVRKVEEARMRTEQIQDDITIQRLRNEGALSKAQQDKEAATRRNYVEWAKTIVAIVGAAITVYGVVSKLTANK